MIECRKSIENIRTDFAENGSLYVVEWSLCIHDKDCVLFKVVNTNLVRDQGLCNNLM